MSLLPIAHQTAFSANDYLAGFPWPVLGNADVTITAPRLPLCSNQ